MKYFDQEKDDIKHSALKNAIKEMLYDKRLKLQEDENIDDAVNRYTGLMDGVYKEWKVFNYGTEEPDFTNYHLNWEDYRGSYLHHVISGGVDYVKTVYDARKSNSMSRELLGSIS